MATVLEADVFQNGYSISSCFHNCDSDRSTEALSVQARNRKVDGHPQKMKETEELLASEMNKLTVQERSKALDDVHCVGEELKESPEMIAQALADFQHIVQTTENPIYGLALNQNRAYVEDPSFRLRFLRANLFNVRKSVHQMMSFLKQKSLYFGEAKVAHDIVPADLNREDIALLRSGLLQVLKDRDRSGRVILYNASEGRMPPNCKPETMIHVVYHIIFNILLSMPKVQTKGFVIVLYDESKGVHTQKSPGFSFLSKVSTFADSLPMRPSSMHICVHTSPGSLNLHNSVAQAVLKAVSGRGGSTRTRLHYGSDMERLYQLTGFGISLYNFPVDKNGNARSEITKSWCDEFLANVPSMIDLQASKENATPKHKKNDGLQEKDVLFGRGRMMQNHAGNVHFRKFLDARAEEYDSLPRSHRIAARIDYTQALILSGARFMKQDETKLWVECDFNEAVEKVAQFFRTQRRKRKL